MGIKAKETCTKGIAGISDKEYVADTTGKTSQRSKAQHGSFANAVVALRSVHEGHDAGGHRVADLVVKGKAAPQSFAIKHSV